MPLLLPEPATVLRASCTTNPEGEALMCDKFWTHPQSLAKGTSRAPVPAMSLVIGISLQGAQAKSGSSGSSPAPGVVCLVPWPTPCF
jgi:hypothetical protein